MQQKIQTKLIQADNYTQKTNIMTIIKTLTKWTKPR